MIWGRGASDDKASDAANLEVFLQLKRMKIPLKRDVIFLSEASEEASSPAGMAVLVERYWDKIACEFALNEGGGGLVADGKIKYMSTVQRARSTGTTSSCPISRRGRLLPSPLSRATMLARPGTGSRISDAMPSLCSTPSR